VQWMRDDEFMWEPYGPAMVMRAGAALKDGRIVEVWNNAHQRGRWPELDEGVSE